VDHELADALAAVDPSPRSRSRLVRDLAVRGAQAVREDRERRAVALKHLRAIADGEAAHDFAAVADVYAARESTRK